MIQVLMPQMGESLAEGTLVRWLKRAGDQVAQDEPLFEISTDKVDTDVPSPAAGVLRQILVGEGETVAVGTPVALVEPAGQAAAAGDPNQFVQPASAVTVPAADDVPTDGRTPSPAAESDRLQEPAGHFRPAQAAELIAFRRKADRAGVGDWKLGVGGSGLGVGEKARVFSPAVLETARRGGLSLDALTAIRGSGRGGRITKRDVEEYLRLRRAAAPAGAAGTLEPAVPPEYVYRPQPDDRRVVMSPVRRKIAHHMTWSVRISPHATAFAECDMSRAAELVRRARQQGEAAPVTYTAIVARAAVRALAACPSLNASIVGDEIVLKPRVHLGVAVALADTDELVVPVIRSADELTLAGLARAIDELARRARDRRLTPEDVQGGTFTVTNPGMFGGLGGTPILHQPQVAILGLGAVTQRPVVVNDAIAIRPIVMMSLTFDHRAADGMVAFRYLARVRELVEAITTDLQEAAGW